MISVLDPFGTAAAFASKWCRVSSDARSGITPEWDKNTAATHACVNGPLRALVTTVWADTQPCFRNIFIETATGCNATCAFCPNNRTNDPRPRTQLDFQLQRRIASQLERLQFSGTIHLFCNNEPMLDRRLSDTLALFRQSCPTAEIKIVSNGITLTASRALALFEAGLSVLTINSYSGSAEIPFGPRDLMTHAEQFANHEVRISIRNGDEVLTSRAGAAPNKPVPRDGFDGFCALPFTDLVISAFGTARLCCFDAIDHTDMGDAASLDLLEIWRGPRFEKARRQLLETGRSKMTPCSTCDFDGFRWPLPGIETRANFCCDGVAHG